MAKAKAKSKARSRVKKSVAPAFEQSGTQQSVSLESRRPPMAWLLTGAIVILGIAAYVWMPSKKGGSSVAAPSGSSEPVARAEWGPQVKLEVLSKFKAPSDNVSGLEADAQGNVYVLADGVVHKFRDGKPAGQLDLKVGLATMAFDGETLVVVPVHGRNIFRVPKSLGKPEQVDVQGVTDLLGVGVSRQNGRIYVADVTQHAIYILDAKGKKKGFLGGNTPAGGNISFVVNLVADGAGNVYTCDHTSGQINKFGPSGKLAKSWAPPWSSPSRERLVVLGDKVYINGFNDRRIFIQDTQGAMLGQSDELSDGSKIKAPTTIGAGMDGNLYLKDGDSIYKLKSYKVERSETKKSAEPKAGEVKPAEAKPEGAQ